VEPARPVLSFLHFGLRTIYSFYFTENGFAIRFADKVGRLFSLFFCPWNEMHTGTTFVYQMIVGTRVVQYRD
jgi:RimJ/RimL family protein N-acetyltransferase